MVVLAVEQLDMQRDADGLSNRLEPVLKQLGIHFAQPFLRELGVPHAPRPPGDIQRHPRQRFIHRRIGGAITPDPGLVPQRLGNALADRNGRILGRVVLVNVQIAGDVAGDIDQRMAAELFDHVIEEADPGRNVISPGTVEINRDADVGFVSLAGDLGSTHSAAYTPDFLPCNTSHLDRRRFARHLSP